MALRNSKTRFACRPWPEGARAWSGGASSPAGRKAITVATTEPSAATDRCNVGSKPTGRQTRFISQALWGSEIEDCPPPVADDTGDVQGFRQSKGGRKVQAGMSQTSLRGGNVVATASGSSGAAKPCSARFRVIWR